MGQKRRASPRKIRASAEFPTTLQLPGTIRIRATAGGKPDSLPRIKMVANTGRPMRLPGFPHPVVIDMEGARFDQDSTPFLIDHKRDLRLGYSDKQGIDKANSQIVAEGPASGTSKTARLFIADARKGFPFQASIGADILKGAIVAKGDTARINGKVFKGPIIHAQATLIRELTGTVLGADSKTSTRIAAILQRGAPNRGNAIMFEEWLEATFGKTATTFSRSQLAKLKTHHASLEAAEADDDDDVDDDDAGEGAGGAGGKLAKTKPATRVRAGRGGRGTQPADGDGDDDDADPDETPLEKRRRIEASEMERVDSIKALFGHYETVQSVLGDDGKQVIKAGTFKAKAIREGMTADEVELRLVKATYAGGGNDGPAIHFKAPVEGEVYAEALAVAVARDRFGMLPKVEARGRQYGYEELFSEQALEASELKDVRNPSLHQLMANAIQAADGLPYSGDRKSDDFYKAYVGACKKIRAAGAGPFSTLTVDSVLENVGNKMLEQRFAMQNVVWPLIAAMKPLNDFKPHALYRMDENLGFIEVGPTGELTHGQLTDTKKTVQAGTHGRIISLSRQHRRNDDLDAFRQIINGLAEGWAWAVEAALARLLLANTGSALFDTPNTIDDDFGLPGLEVAERVFMDTVGSNGKPQQFSPDRVLVGTQDGLKAKDIFGKSSLLASSANNSQIFVENSFQNKYLPITWPYISNTAIRDPKGKVISASVDSDRWYMFCNPDLLAALIVGLLDGRRVPFIESDETSFDTPGGMQWRGYGDFGVAYGSPQGAVLSTGDATSA